MVSGSGEVVDGELFDGVFREVVCMMCEVRCEVRCEICGCRFVVLLA